MNHIRQKLNGIFVCLVAAVLPVSDGQAAQVVEAAAKPGKEWKSFSTRTLDDLPASVLAQTNYALTKYGGALAKKNKATGFFHAAKIDGRWFIIDPDGGEFIGIGMSSVTAIRTPGAEAALRQKFGSATNWAEQTVKSLRAAGFNMLGAWSDDGAFRKVAQRMPYAKIVSFMGAYGQKRGGTVQQPGHMGYPEDCIFVFDPDFEKFCKENAKELAATKNDPWLIGYFSDNELPFKHDALRKYLKLPATDAGYQAALKLLQARHGGNATTNEITASDENDFLGVVVARYFSIVSSAIKKVDPNHLYLGTRLYGSDKSTLEIFKMAGPFVDVLSVNYYNAWTPDTNRMDMWGRESGKPFIVTEWYAKGVDSGLANTGGAGWLVKTQHERGLFYQNFTLGLLECPGCVGWFWFKYIDNDPDDTLVDPSNRDSNKGIVSNRYEPYTPLIEKMTELNGCAYGVANYFLSQPVNAKTANSVE